MFGPDIFGTRERKNAATCPNCDTPHHYVEYKFPMINDRGTWVIECNSCAAGFIVHLRNPRESVPDGFRVLARHDDDIDPYEGDLPHAGAEAIYNLNLNEQTLSFDFAAEPLYSCASCGESMEGLALAALDDNYIRVAANFRGLINFMVARRTPKSEFAFVRVPFACACGGERDAIFYHPMPLPDDSVPEPSDFLLAHVSGTDLSKLTGVVTKTRAMAVLDKLIVRWRVLCEQIVIITPFVGHQYKTKPERLEIWERLLSSLDASRTVLVTRAATYKEYKAALLDAGFDHDMLARFGLENKVVSAGTTKQDSHAKVYMGLGDQCEILSGSANIVSGKSMENITFAGMDTARAMASYIDPLKLTLAKAPPRASHHLIVEIRAGEWRAGWEEGPAPSLTDLS
jgi:hypothetical protein